MLETVTLQFDPVAFARARQLWSYMGAEDHAQLFHHALETLDWVNEMGADERMEVSLKNGMMHRVVSPGHVDAMTLSDVPIDPSRGTSEATNGGRENSREVDLAFQFNEETRERLDELKDHTPERNVASVIRSSLVLMEEIVTRICAGDVVSVQKRRGGIVVRSKSRESEQIPWF
jgi:hypothetical protein